MKELPIQDEMMVAEETVDEISVAASVPDERPVEMVTVCDIQFRNNSKVYYFAPGDLEVTAGTDVIIETSRGLEYGQCVRGNHTLPIYETVSPLRSVVRIATAQDTAIDKNNREREKKAYQLCLKKIEELGLDMQLVSAECAFDGSKILFFFTAAVLHNIAAHKVQTRGLGGAVVHAGNGLGICLGLPGCRFQVLFQSLVILADHRQLGFDVDRRMGMAGRKHQLGIGNAQGFCQLQPVLRQKGIQIAKVKGYQIKLCAVFVHHVKAGGVEIIQHTLGKTVAAHAALVHRHIVVGGDVHRCIACLQKGRSCGCGGGSAALWGFAFAAAGCQTKEYGKNQTSAK